MSLKHLPIWRDANRFLLDVEQAVRHFPRYHKYTLGSELRQNALLICNLIQRAWRQKERQCGYLQDLQGCIDELKIHLHLAKKLGAFRRFSQFEYKR